MSDRTFECCRCCDAGVDADTHLIEGRDWHEADCDACNGYRFTRDEYLALISEVERAAAEKAWNRCAGSAFYSPGVRGQVDHPVNPYRRKGEEK